MKNNIRVFIISLCLTLLWACGIYANTTVYETVQESPVTKGVTYKKVRQVTDSGLRDVYILTVSLDDPNITLGAVESKKEYSLKEPLTELLIDNNSIAGVNGDFFGMSGSHSLSFGPVLKDGKIVSFTSGINNSGYYEFASFFIDRENNPFVSFFKVNLNFFNDGKANLHLFALNKVSDMKRPIAVTRDAMNDTAALDRRFKDLYKISVENDKIIHISGKGETVSVPQNGYLIVMNAETANNCLFNYSVGQRGKMEIYPEIDLNKIHDLNKIQMSIGGGGKILQDGQLSKEGSVAAGRHPRTAIGVSEDKKKVIIMAVDGRTHSVGATHEETAELLKKFGAYNAMHFDGGGSTTMALQMPGQQEPHVVNRPSDGSQRKVINGLGIYNRAPFGKMSSLVVYAGQKNIVYRKAGINLDIYGTDEYLRRIPVDRSEVVISPNDPNGFFAGDVYYPQSLGEITVLTAYKDLISETKLSCRELKELRPNRRSITAMEGDEIPVSFVGIDHLGEESLINSPMTFTVVPADAGVVENGVFKPKSSADGYIECTLADVSCFIKFRVGGISSLLEGFDGKRGISFSGYPGNVTGSVSFAPNPADEASQTAALKYSIPKTDVTSAAYLDFGKAISIPDKPAALRAEVFGDASGLWLRGKITDADGASSNIDFAGEVNWEGWKAVNAILPDGIKYPITLDRIYLVTLQSAENLSGQIFINTVHAVYERPDSNILLPIADKFQDPLQVNLGGAISETSYDITVLGSMIAEEKTAAYTQTQNKIIEAAKQNAKRALFIGETDISSDIGIPVYKWDSNYAARLDENVCIIQMSAAKGTISQTNPWQWGKFASDIKSSGKNSVIIMLDRNPLNFSMIQEAQMFYDELAALRKSGKTVFVVSADGGASSLNLVDGVRYINLGGLWNADGSKNKDFKLLRFRISGGDIRFELKDI